MRCWLTNVELWLQIAASDLDGNGDRLYDPPDIFLTLHYQWR